MRLLALDQASLTSGWAVFEDGKLIAFDKFTVDIDDLGKRLMRIREVVQGLINIYKVDYVIFEDIQLQTNRTNNVHTFKVLAEVFGVIYELLTELEIPNEAVLSVTWKSILGLKGADRKAQKKAAQMWVYNTYGLKPTQDECDAICIGAHYFMRDKKIKKNDWSD